MHLIVLFSALLDGIIIEIICVVTVVDRHCLVRIYGRGFFLEVSQFPRFCYIHRDD